MAARRKAPRRRAKKSFNVSAIELGTALSLAQSSGAATAIQTALGGDLSGALTSLESSVMSNKNRIIGTLGAAFVAKALTKGFTSGTLAKLGPIRVKA
jgi:hypothetical protein|tara:strand:+ start:718 stop:1011 length:294 start_codon:yes stop_codon:yes gene_type:complete